jgi:hypothetical protein
MENAWYLLLRPIIILSYSKDIIGTRMQYKTFSFLLFCIRIHFINDLMVCVASFMMMNEKHYLCVLVSETSSWLCKCYFKWRIWPLGHCLHISNSMVLSIFWVVDTLYLVKKFLASMKPEGSSLCSPNTAVGSCPVPFESCLCLH